MPWSCTRERLRIFALPNGPHGHAAATCAYCARLVARVGQLRTAGLAEKNDQARPELVEGASMEETLAWFAILRLALIQSIASMRCAFLSR